MDEATQAGKQARIATFNPNEPAANNGKLFGLPFNFEESEVVILPVPWEVTVSYRPGTANGPQAIMDASTQVDLYDPDLPDAWKHGIFMLDISREWIHANNRLRPRTTEILRYLESGHNLDDKPQLRWTQEDINKTHRQLEQWVFEQCLTLVQRGKLVGLLGGDHSTPLGYIKALSTQYDSFGILQIDAHADLREAYEGFDQSHASISYNFMKLEQIERLVIVGLRDFCDEELLYIDQSKGRVKAFTDRYMSDSLSEGRTYQELCREIVDTLPQKVYITFDIDGLDPKLCPNTGTPVPGGPDLARAVYLLREVVASGRQIIGFDLVEVAPGDDEWDASVGARLLYKLCNLMVKSQR